MGRPPFEVADILRLYGRSFEEACGSSISADQRRVMAAIQACRTAVLGGHAECCGNCGHVDVEYNSCRDRHCPKCGSLAKDLWLEKRREELLPVEYFHVVFTVPEPIADVALQNKRTVYDILFRSTAETLRQIAADPKHLGARIGFLGVLHTWGQNLLHHPHVHCVVPGGGISPDGNRWVSCRKGFFLPVKVLSRLFRRLFLEAMKQAFDAGRLEFHGRLEGLSEPRAFGALMAAAGKAEWVVYSKPPFGGSSQVLDYLGRYTHRVAISNHRLLGIEGGKVTFRWKDYRRGNARGTMTLDAHEFIRRFLLHTLPKGFVRIRHFGFLGNRYRKENIAQCRRLLDVPQPEPQASPLADWKARYEALTGEPVDLCPACRQGRMLPIGFLPPILYDRPRPRMDSS